MESHLSSSENSGDLSDLQAWLNITKSGFAVGFLTLPMVIGRVGVVPGLVCMFFYAPASLWLALLVGKCKNKLAHKESEETDPLRNMEAPDKTDKVMLEGTWDAGFGYFHEVMGAAFGNGGRVTLVLGVIAVQLACGVLYISTIAESVPAAFPACSRNGVFLGICIILSVLSLTNRLRRISYLSAAGVLTYVIIFVCLVYEGTKQDETMQGTVVLWKREGYDYGPICGAAPFLFGNLFISDCVHREMRHKSHFAYVTAAAYGATLALGLCFMLVGYYVYGDAAKEIIYLNFSSSRLLCVVCITIVLSISFILQQVPVFMFLQTQFPGVHYTAINISVVCVLVFTSYLLPDVATGLDTIANVVDLIAIWIFPVACFLRLSHRYERCEQFTSAFILLVGIVGAVAAFASA